MSASYKSYNTRDIASTRRQLTVALADGSALSAVHKTRSTCIQSNVIKTQKLCTFKNSSAENQGNFIRIGFSIDRLIGHTVLRMICLLYTSTLPTIYSV